MAECKYPFYLHQRFDNFELFAAAVQGWDVDFRQLDCGEFQTEIRQLATPEVLITEALFNRRLDQKGGSPPGNWTFGLLEESSPDVKWRGQTMSDQMMAVFPPGCDIDASSPPGFHALTISIRADVVEEWDALYQMNDRGKIQPLCTLINLDPLSLAAIRRTARRAIKAAGSCRSAVHETVQELPNLVVGALSEARSIRPSPSGVKRFRLVNVLTSYIDDHLHSPISLAELCTVAKVAPALSSTPLWIVLGYPPNNTFKLAA